MFFVALAATCGSLFFSEIATWVPCKDCWFQRIFMYPQVVLLAIALWKKDKGIAQYILVLSLIGMLIAADHYSDQVEAAWHPVPDANGVNTLLKPCDASGVSCAATQIKFAYGYITIPMMALTAFGLNVFGSFFLLRKPR
jgi:disulfide bond formation protein DsbB